MTIAEVSRVYQIPVDTLRYYERIGLLPPVNRNRSGFRDYTEENCSWVQFIKCMRAAGIQVEALADYVALFQQGDRTREARKQILLEQRELLQTRVNELQGTLDLLTRKIESYEEWNPGAEEQLLDGDQIPSWAAVSVNSALCCGVMDAVGGQSRPNDPLTRAEAVQMLYRALSLNEKE